MGIDILTLAAARAGKGGGGASKYAQPDWGVEENGVLFPETTLEVDPDAGGAMIMTPFNHIPEDGKTYTVNYNGVAYECISTLVTAGADQMHIMGNGAAMGLDVPESDAPFLLMVRTKEQAEQTGISAVFAPFDGSESCSLSVGGVVMHAIPEEYMGNANLPYFVNVKRDADSNCVHYENIKELIKKIESGTQVYLNDGGMCFPVCYYNRDGNVMFGGIRDIVSGKMTSGMYYRLHEDGTVDFLIV